ncbi:hypothetical protein [Candidatus Nitrosarchaeum limnium]|uniref:hypothetical protein n=1 Tax=Candidatus Nitrosarchaeum limnium TaxID=1007084 RepID=UPI00026CE2BC|nr:hypothetical protein [Candidatus Nitrosarchaeum limnium]
MSQIHLQTRQPKPSEILVQSTPVKKGRKLETIKCKVCFAPTAPDIYNTYTGIPLVLKCTQCGCKSWSTIKHATNQ